MKNKKGFNFIFVILAIPIFLALSRDITFDPLTFKKPALDTLYLIVFIMLLILMFRKKKDRAQSLK